MRKRGMRTRAIVPPATSDPSMGASAPDIVLSNNFPVDAEMPFSAADMTDDTPYTYTRWGNPTIRRLEHTLASIEGGEGCVCLATGMAAITGIYHQLLGAGDHLIIAEVCYPGALELCESLLEPLGVAVSRVDAADADAVRAAVRPQTRLIYVESPCNPVIKLTDIRAMAEIAATAGALLVVDSTFATPVATRPLELGADLVVHSLSKYLGGHGDALGGAIIGECRIIEAIRKSAVIHLGGALSPFSAWLILRGLATFPLRMAAHAENAIAVAHHLESHTRVTKVLYPGLPSHPQHGLAKAQMENFSGMIAFQADDPVAAAVHMSQRLEVFHYAVSLGHHRSLIFYVPTEDLQRTSLKLDDAGLARYREWAGDGVFRVSVGLEDAADLIADLDQALEL